MKLDSPQRAAALTHVTEAAGYRYIAGDENDIQPAPTRTLLRSAIRRTHSLIWAGGRLDPLQAFDEWSKLLFAKVHDERTTPNGQPRGFQPGSQETTASVANRVRQLFSDACRRNPSIFQPSLRLELSDAKIAEVAAVLAPISFTRTDIDSIGGAFEQFFGSVFRGELGQYFTRRPIARFAVALLDIGPDDHVIDPTAGSGGFLIETVFQVWHRLDDYYRGQDINRLKSEFATSHVHGIEIHDVLSRICKINLMLHNDGHTNIESGRSCLDSEFTNRRLNPPTEQFTRVVGNPPFGTRISANDDDRLGANTLRDFVVCAGRGAAASEHLILERSIDLLTPGGRLALVLPDGLLNNPGSGSNCPQVRWFLATRGRITAIVSLPDHAFRDAGAQNKTSILFFEKFTKNERDALDAELDENPDAPTTDETDTAVTDALAACGLDYPVFLAEAEHIGYAPTGAPTEKNDLYRPGRDDLLARHQRGTILGEWLEFTAAGPRYRGRRNPDCASVAFSQLWNAHKTNRLDPKYHLFKIATPARTPANWIETSIRSVMRRRLNHPDFPTDREARYRVMTLGQTGEIRDREAGKGINPPEWLAAYLAATRGEWFEARTGDVVFSQIDLWKGSIAVVPPEFDKALVSKEFPIYEITDDRLSADFVQALLRTRYYRRAFRAITTGHSNRRRAQSHDFLNLRIVFPDTKEEQDALIRGIREAREIENTGRSTSRREWSNFNDAIDRYFTGTAAQSGAPRKRA